MIMRERRKIKFRGWYTPPEAIIANPDKPDGGYWVYGQLRMSAENMPSIENYSRQGTVTVDELKYAMQQRNNFPCNRDSIGQFTELQDSTGRDIYEGDILSDGNQEVTVVYFGGAYYGMRPNGEIHMIDMLYYLLKAGSKSKWKVIDNKFERDMRERKCQK